MSSCIILSKRYLNEYNVIPGVEVQSSSIKDLKVSSEEECAKACSLEKKYTFDFDKSPKLKFKNPSSESFSVVSIETCASQCLEKSDCLAFEFCSDKYSSKCRLSVNNITETNVENEETCDINIKNIKTQKPFVTSNSVTAANVGYKPGLAAFLAILMLAVGASIGAVVMWYVSSRFSLI
ncbi:hypothetical protein B4U79_17000 [Dinothrombium tinctorium]|uniref:Apple domain-containing protein n=1 Tax=Dinothrombium tinctorium TaxID=1965070 RepID=A0A443Q9A2_9ACAR|nr:hypothetical protein B4U79_17000 [Dinothrombium tinctorium]